MSKSPPDFNVTVSFTCGILSKIQELHNYVRCEVLTVVNCEY